MSSHSHYEISLLDGNRKSVDELGTLSKGLNYEISRGTE